MEFIERLNRSVAYMEQNLQGEIDIDRAARCAYLSKDNFLRRFMHGVLAFFAMNTQALHISWADKKARDLSIDFSLRKKYKTS